MQFVARGTTSRRNNSLLLATGLEEAHSETIFSLKEFDADPLYLLHLTGVLKQLQDGTIALIEIPSTGADMTWTRFSGAQAIHRVPILYLPEHI